ncbi:DUF3772 domain-containing protein [Paracoccus lutimaris]|uniref:Small-conductance mechanosensitive channel n=1 Tax=Paracoccus lutimaris TaxID=1490030 RepID=A0A368YPB0_9RHOB|nr:DUF3772 domain-containing protein [Paracoccus lutimaris]RCW79984.1 small-conductance mechanosensitive channel [Paracoccus lutimaris]
MLSRILALFLALCLALALPAAAQEPQAPNYDAWNKQADQAEQILETGQANAARLQAIRTEVVKWRDQFKSQDGVNATRIATLKDQIAALGAPPAEGQTETDDVAARRKELNEQMAELQAPGLKAVEAYGRADGIIAQIDQAIRTQQTYALIQRTSSPLNPANWAPAMTEAAKVATSIYTESRGRWVANGGMKGIAGGGLPFVIGFLLMAVLLLTRGRKWIDSLPGRLAARFGDRSRAAALFAVSLGQIAIPFIGVILATGALYATDLFGEWGEPLLFSIPAAGLSYYGGVWLARRLYPEEGSGVVLPLPLTEKLRAQARFRATMLALSLAMHQLVARTVLPLAGFNSEGDKEIGTVPERLSNASAGVWHFMLILLGAFYLFNLCNILRRMKGPENAPTPYRVPVVALLGRLGRLVAVGAPIGAALGYVTAANAVLWATVLTLALVGLLIILQDFIADLYRLAVGGDDSVRESLIPGLIGFALVLISLPFFALIWGARNNDLSEAWSKVQQGVSLGGVTLSPMGILTFLLVFGLGYSGTRFVQGAFRNTILPKTHMDTGGQNAVVSIIGYIGIGLASMLAVTSAGIDLTSLAFVAGALSVGIGFGMQQVVSNFVSGIILLVERPVAVGDWIEVGGKQGVVKKMAVRATQIQTFDRNEIIVPNSDLITQPVTNWTRGNLTGRIIVPVGVAYGTDTRRVEEILREIAEDQPTVMINPAPAVLFRSFGADSLNFEIRAMLSDINGGVGVTSEINHAIAKRFAEEGIEIPYAQRDVWIRNPEALVKAEKALASGETGADEAPSKPEPAPEVPEKRRPIQPDEAPESDGGADDGDADGER